MGQTKLTLADLDCIPTTTEIRTWDIEPIHFLVEPYIILNEYNMIGGFTGTMKSTFALWMVKRSKRPVYYIDMENSQNSILRRLAMLNVDNPEVKYWGDWESIEADGKELRPPKLDSKIYVELAKKEKPVFVFDTLNRYLPKGDINSNSDMAWIYRHIGPLKRAGATIIMLHQSTKPTADGFSQAFLGAAEIQGSFDHGVHIRDHVDVSKDRDNPQTGIRVDNKKSRLVGYFQIDLVFDPLFKEFLELPGEGRLKDKVSRHFKQLDRIKEMRQALTQDWYRVNELEVSFPDIDNLKAKLKAGDGHLWVSRKVGQQTTYKVLSL